jgi:hypothetical protein
VGAATALAAGPLHGKSYEGGAPSSGITSEGHHRVTLRAGGNITLRVSGNGRSVTVHFSSSAPVLYCRTTQKLQVQSTHAASISRSGSFNATVNERFKAGPGAPAIVQTVSGRFSGGSVAGSIRTTAGAFCSGTSHFSAKAH